MASSALGETFGCWLLACTFISARPLPLFSLKSTVNTKWKHKHLPEIYDSQLTQLRRYTKKALNELLWRITTFSSVFYNLRSMKQFSNLAKLAEHPGTKQCVHFWNTTTSWDRTGWDVFLQHPCLYFPLQSTWIQSQLDLSVAAHPSQQKTREAWCLWLRFRNIWLHISWCNIFEWNSYVLWFFSLRTNCLVFPCLKITSFWMIHSVQVASSIGHFHTEFYSKETLKPTY